MSASFSQLAALRPELAGSCRSAIGSCPRTAHSATPPRKVRAAGTPGALGEKLLSRLTPPRASGRPFAATRSPLATPASSGAKVRLYETMRRAKVGKAELARRLKWHLPQVDRLLAMTHGSKLEQLEAAFRALGKRLVVEIEDAPSTPRPRVARRQVSNKGKTRRRASAMDRSLRRGRTAR